MRAILVAAAVLLGVSSHPSLAEDQGKSQSSDRPQTVPVQPERTTQQSDQSREQDRPRADDVRPGLQERGSDRKSRDDQNDRERTGQQLDRDTDRDDRTVGRNWRSDDDRASRYAYPRGYYDDRPRRRVKICVEYEDGGEYCRFRD